MRLCVFCGSSRGHDQEFTKTVKELGNIIVQSEMELIYGGGNVGLMGELSTTVMQADGKVTGVIPEFLYRKVDHARISELIITKDMHDRKAKMYELADAFLALPGGIGTMEEFFEAFTWLQLGYHSKPVALLNINRFFDHLIDFLNNMAAQGFLKQTHLNNLIIESDSMLLIKRIKNFSPYHGDKW